MFRHHTVLPTSSIGLLTRGRYQPKGQCGEGRIHFWGKWLPEARLVPNRTQPCRRVNDSGLSLAQMYLVTEVNIGREKRGQEYTADWSPKPSFWETTSIPQTSQTDKIRKQRLLRCISSFLIRTYWEQDWRRQGTCMCACLFVVQVVG